MMKLSDLDLDLRLPKPPLVLVAVLVIGAFVPVGVASAIWFKRNYFDPNPRIHIFHDMDHQAKKKAQSTSDVHVDGRAAQAYPAGTVAYSRNAIKSDPTMLKDDDLAYRGFEIDPKTGEKVLVDAGEGGPQPKYLSGYPETIEVTEAFIKRGQQRYQINCYTCHGSDGKGLGPTRRATAELSLYDSSVTEEKKTGTAEMLPANLRDLTKFSEDIYVNGRLFNTITHGQGTMGPVGLQISVKDRWAIVAYVRAMQELEKQQAQPADPDAE